MERFHIEAASIEEDSDGYWVCYFDAMEAITLAREEGRREGRMEVVNLTGRPAKRMEIDVPPKVREPMAGTSADRSNCGHPLGRDQGRRVR